MVQHSLAPASPCSARSNLLTSQSCTIHTDPPSKNPHNTYSVLSLGGVGRRLSSLPLSAWVVLFVLAQVAVTQGRYLRATDEQQFILPSLVQAAQSAYETPYRSVSLMFFRSLFTSRSVHQRTLRSWMLNFMSSM